MQTHYETERLILEVCTPDRAYDVLRFYKKNFHIFQPYDPICPSNYYTEEYQYRSLAAEYSQFLEKKGVRFYLFESSHPDKIMGTISFNNITHGFTDNANIGYKIDEGYQHMGYATEAIKKGIEIMFTEENLHRLTAYIMQDNLPSINLIQRLDFSYEGIAREYACIQGQWTDHLQYSLINHLS